MPHDSVFFGRTTTVVATAKLDNVDVANPAFAWSSTDTTIAVVDSTGTVLGVGSGAVTITAKTGDASATTNLRVMPQRADGGVAFTLGSPSDFKLCALATDVVYCRGIPTATDTAPMFARMPGGAGEHFISVESSINSTCALATDGRVKCWGTNGVFTFARTGVVNADTGAIAISTDLRFSVFSHGGVDEQCGIVKTTNVVQCWGRNREHQLGRETFLGNADSLPAPVDASIQAKLVNTGNWSTCILDITGAAFCSGFGNVDRFTLGVEPQRTAAEVPLAVTGGLSFASMSVGDQHECAITLTGDGYCWGRNSYGQLGLGNNSESPLLFGPQVVPGNLKFAVLTTLFISHIPSSEISSCGITSDGDLYCWGAFPPRAVSSRMGGKAFSPTQLLK
ncbi:MAG: Ig-like domain-containing protein, partial [Gemmatimonadota bacterium]|nr:Ig-like domain-containing protein [Gemmatimonadota bacterium]